MFLGTGSLSTGYHTPNLTGGSGGSGGGGGGPVRLTKDMLLVTQKHRAMDVRPKPEAYAKYVLLSLCLIVRF